MKAHVEWNDSEKTPQTNISSSVVYGPRKREIRSAKLKDGIKRSKEDEDVEVCDDAKCNQG